MSSVPRKLENLALRCTALGERQNEVLHRFIGRIQAETHQIESLTMGQIVERVEDAVQKVETGRRGV
jgi:hypothetical protein